VSITEPSESFSPSSATYESETDEIVHFDWSKGMRLGGHYEIRRKLGDGTFGRVVECVDLRQSSSSPCFRVAVKIIRDVKRYVENALVEARILTRLHTFRRAYRDHEGGRGIVRLYDVFHHNDRIFCMSFERLGKTLYEVIQMNNHKGFYLSDIQLITRELLEVIDFIHSVCALIHTDIKMENIMFTSDEFARERDAPKRYHHSSSYARPVLLSRTSSHKSIRLIDFGNGVFPGDRHSSVINTRQYRSPEVILEQEWDAKSDLWSVGCVVAEMYSGELLFPTHENGEHLAMIERVTGDVFSPEYFSYSPGEIRDKLQDRRSGLLNLPTDPSSLRKIDQQVPLVRMFPRGLGELVGKLLRIDPKRRYDARRALDRCDFLNERIRLDE
jgi:dual-specificity kinase